MARMTKRTETTRKGKPKALPVASPQRSPAPGFDKVFEKIYRLVLRVPPGRVMTYGQIARLLEERYSPRLVGWAMHATPHDERNIPWHRVINSRGATSTGRITIQEPDLQRLMLEAEGVVFDERGHCDLGVYQWSPRQRAAKAKIERLRAKSSRAGHNKKTSAAPKKEKKKKPGKK